MKPRAFVLMPFAEEFDDIYGYLIHEPLSEAGYDVMRADDILNQRNILEDIIQSIINSELIVADLSKANPNVYYELGLAHAYEKNFLLLAQDIKEVPFDLQSYRIITYGTHFAQMNNAQQEIQKLIESVRTDDVKFGSPVTDFGVSVSPLCTDNTQSSVAVSDEQDERGLLDCQVEIEESAEIITQVIAGFKEHLLDPLILELRSATERLIGPEKDSPKKKRKTMRSLAIELDKHTSWLQQSNNQYRQALGNMGQSLDAMLSGEFKSVAPEDKAKLAEFVQVLGDTEGAIREMHTSSSGLVSNMDALPRIEKEFNRSNRLMSIELKTFINNVEQTESVMARARNAATRLLGDSI